MTNAVILLTGSHLERRNKNGSLKRLTIKEMAEWSYSRNGKIFTPQQTWEKNFTGQVTLGRIGIPVIRYCPIDWLPLKLQEQIKKKMNENL